MHCSPPATSRGVYFCLPLGDARKTTTEPPYALSIEIIRQILLLTVLLLSWNCQNNDGRISGGGWQPPSYYNQRTGEDRRTTTTDNSRCRYSLRLWFLIPFFIYYLCLFQGSEQESEVKRKRRGSEAEAKRKQSGAGEAHLAHVSVRCYRDVISFRLRSTANMHACTYSWHVIFLVLLCGGGCHAPRGCLSLYR